MTKKNRIADAVKALGLENEKAFTYKQLTEIAKMANAQIVDVMYYLRYER